MIEEIERLKSDLKHTSSARARAENREDEVRSSLTTAEGELREARGELQVAQNDLVETREGLKSAQSELQLVREELITSRGEQRDLQAELRVVTGDLNDKEKQLEIARREASEGKVLLETARRESSEAVNLSRRLSEECRSLRVDLHQQVSMVAQRDEVVRQLRDQAGAQWASGWLAFNGKPFTRTQIWISTLTSQVMRRRRNPPVRTIPKSVILLTWLLLILHRLMPEF